MRLPSLFILSIVMIDAMGIGLVMPIMPQLIVDVQGSSLANAAIWGGVSGKWGWYRELKSKPWEVSPLECDGECVYAPGTSGFKTWPRARELRAALESSANE